MEMQEDVRDRNSRSRQWAAVTDSTADEFCIAVAADMCAKSTHWLPIWRFEFTAPLRSDSSERPVEPKS